MRELSDFHYPDVDEIILVIENRNNNSPTSFYEAFDPNEAPHLAILFNFPYMPKHGNWLNPLFGTI
jgi:hypothetical protein